MVVTRGGAASASPGGGGRGGGGGGRGGGGGKKRTPASPDSPAKRNKTGKDAGAEASAPKAKAPPAAAGKGSAAAQQRRPWARLLSQSSQTPHLPISGNEFSVGTSEDCDLRLDDQAASRILCILRHLEHGGPFEVHLEVTGKKGRVEINRKRLNQGTKVPLTGGDEIVFGQCGKHAYIFQHPLSDKVTKAVPISDLALLQAPVTNTKQLENRTGDKSADASVPNPLREPAVPATSAGDNNQRVVESALENQSDCIRFLDPPATSSLSGWQTFKDGLKLGIFSPDDINVTLDNFPYYLSENTKEVLLSCALIHMERKEFVKRLQEIKTLNQRILLTGPSGSEIYQETLIKALAKHFNARLLIVDSLLLCGTSSMFQESLKDVRRDDAPTSSSGADTVGTHVLHPAALPKQDSSKATSDRSTFREGNWVKYIGPGLIGSLNLVPRGPTHGSRGKVMLAFEKNRFAKVGVRFNNQIPDGNDLGGLCNEKHGFFCHAGELQPDSSVCEVDSLALDKLIEVISEESASSNLIVLLKDVEKSFSEFTESHASLRNQLPLGVLIIGSRIQAEKRKDQSRNRGLQFPRLLSGNQTLLNILQDNLGSRSLETNRCAKSTEYLNELFPNEISIQLPENEAQLLDLKKQLEHDTEILKAKANVLTMRKFLTCKEIECNDLEEFSIKDRLLTNENVDTIVGHALAHHLRNTPSLPKDGKMVLPIESLKYGSSVVQNTHIRNKSSKNALKAVVTENEFEKNLLSDVIPPKDIGVTFEDIGALDNVKDTLKELVMVPLQRPELFSKGNLRKPVKGILLFGPPGTGKTMIAKAVATEAGANFINVSMSSITSKWLGEGEKYVKAIFSLASKLSPAVIFVDEVDSFLGRRENPGEQEATRKMKNEFMINWEGLRTKEQERVLVLGATNRPFDLDEAVIRRFPRRLMVSLPDASNREKILKVILSKEELAPDVDLQLLANMTDGYSGNDLKNLCMAAAQYPIREVMEKERKGKSLARDEGRTEPPPYGSEGVRPLSMADLKLALEKVGASFSPDSRNTNELVKWNDQYGEGGSRKKETLTYFM